MSAAPRRTVCRACGWAPVEVFHRAHGVPVHASMLLSDAATARAVPSGDLELACCARCGFVQNSAFDDALVRYGEGYEDTQAHSPTFVDFARRVARRLGDAHGLDGTTVLEVGCGKGDFLRIACAELDGPGVGYDPALASGALDDGALDLRLEPRAYDAAVDEPAGLVVCRHTLEHVAHVADFVGMLRASLRDRRPVVYLEVPDAGRILRDVAFWDVYYEHCSYFTGPTLQALVEQHGFEVLDVRLDYDDQYLLVECRPTGASPGADPGLSRHAARVLETARRFDAAMEVLRDEWSRRVVAWRDEGRSTVIWGGGSKTVGFLAATGIAELVDSVVDVNPRKRGRYLPGSGLRIDAPEDLRGRPPDVVVVMNPIYTAEIAATLSAIGLEPELVTP